MSEPPPGVHGDPLVTGLMRAGRQRRLERLIEEERLLEEDLLAALFRPAGEASRRRRRTDSVDYAIHRDAVHTSEQPPSGDGHTRPNGRSASDVLGHARGADGEDRLAVSRHLPSPESTAPGSNKDEHAYFLAAAGVAERVRQTVGATVEVPHDDRVVIDYGRERMFFTATSRDWSRLSWHSPLVGDNAEIPTHLAPDCGDFDHVAETIARLAGDIRDLELRRR